MPIPDVSKSLTRSGYYLTKAGRAATVAAERITEAVIVPAMI
jgi:hypothetical protein